LGMRSRAVTLVEILVVIVIIILLAALITPLLLLAPRKALEASCMANLRQVSVAWALYGADNNESWPWSMTELADQIKDKSILKCPADRWRNGANAKYFGDIGKPVSYFTVPSSAEFRRELLEADPNPGIAYCINHGEQEDAFGPADPRNSTTGRVLRLRLDGSIRATMVGHFCSEATSNGMLRGRPDWMLLTDARPCPSPWCSGLDRPCD
jgi:type II secretory pathway pseudopilin PulG